MANCNLWQVEFMASVTYGKQIMARETEPKILCCELPLCSSIIPP